MFFQKNRQQRFESELRKIEQKQVADREHLQRSICASLARGNVTLQNGEYIAAQNLDDIQAELAAYFLPEESCK